MTFNNALMSVLVTPEPLLPWRGKDEMGPGPDDAPRHSHTALMQGLLHPRVLGQPILSCVQSCTPFGGNVKRQHGSCRSTWRTTFHNEWQNFVQYMRVWIAGHSDVVEFSWLACCEVTETATSVTATSLGTMERKSGHNLH